MPSHGSRADTCIHDDDTATLCSPALSSAPALAAAVSSDLRLRRHLQRLRGHLGGAAGAAGGDPWHPWAGLPHPGRRAPATLLLPRQGKSASHSINCSEIDCKVPMIFTVTGSDT